MRETTTHHAPIAAAAQKTAATPHFARLRRLLEKLWRARAEFIGIALLLGATVGILAVIAAFAGYDTTSLLIVAVAAAWGAFVTAVACAIYEARRSDLPPTPPGRG